MVRDRMGSAKKCQPLVPPSAASQLEPRPFASNLDAQKLSLQRRVTGEPLPNLTPPPPDHPAPKLTTLQRSHFNPNEVAVFPPSVSHPAIAAIADPAPIQASAAKTPVIQRMPLETFDQRVKTVLPEAYAEFYAYFKQQYIETEAAGGFLKGGVMYDWDYKNYIKDPAYTLDMLNEDLKAFQSVQAERLEKVKLLNEPTTPFKTITIGGQEITDEKIANQEFATILKAFEFELEQDSKTAKQILQKQYTRRHIQVVLNSVSNSVREQKWTDLITVAEIYGQTVPQKRLIFENETRLGFEIEPGGNFKVHPNYLDIVDSLTNVTLASTDALEFIIDDLNSKTKLCQIEFRTKPLSKERISETGGSLGEEIRKAIASFPITQFNNPEFSAIASALKSRGWTPHAALAKVCQGLSPVQFGRLKAPGNLAQHVTHSLPISAFLGLAPEHKKLILPGSEGVNNIMQFIQFFLDKINQQVSGNTINITTTGRNKSAPNIKSALDTIIGMLNVDLSQAAIRYFCQKIPEYAQVVDQVGQIPSLKTHEEIPDTPIFNPDKGTGALSGEEKLKPPLFDVMRNDIRVLVEHRADPLVEAVNAALSGNSKALQPYVEAFQALDNVKGDSVFSRWFA
ncbi:hypothetical protein [Almyronema epifaneia]|uniref:Uncharacterized protein n=1 Tax=Almyronema epifaneia S1 TaxID=2991925 RepID=A0ABW6IDN0_9CYAN